MNYTISYYSGAGTYKTLMKNAVVPSGGKLSKNSYIAPAGFEFAGWSFNNNSSIPSKMDEVPIPDFAVKKSTDQAILAIDDSEYPAGSAIKLYACYRPVNYKITYVMNGGTLETTNPATYTIFDEKALLSPNKSGYTFTGWYLDSKCKTRLANDKIEKGTVGNLKLYAGFKK